MSLVPRDYQARIIGKVIGGVESENLSTFMIQLPTGAGKTLIGIELARYFYRTRGWTTNWVAMRRKLLVQVRAMQQLHYPEDAHLQYLTPVSMFDRDPPHADVTVVDESHHDACTSSSVNHARVQPKLVIGLSATPMRTDKLRLAFQRTIVDAGIHRLIGEGWLSQFHHWNTPKHDSATVAQFYLREREKWGKTAVFFLSIHDCYRFKQLLLLEGVRCNVVSSRQPEEEREERLAEFENGPVGVVANVQILAEGYNFEGLKTVFVRDSSRLPAIQISGRALRLHESKTDGANIVQSIDTHWPFTRTASAKSTNLWRDGRWLTLHGKNEKIEEAHEAYSQAIPQSIFEPLPKLLADMQAKRRARIWRRN